MRFGLKRISFGRLAAMALVAGVLFVPAQRSHALLQETAAHAGDHSTPEAQDPAKKEEEQESSYQYTHSPAVQTFGRMVGLNPDQAATVFTLINFVLLASAVLYGLAKMLPKTFRNRNTAIQKGLVDARTATEEARARLSAVEARLSRLDEQIGGMRQQAEADAEREAEKLRAGVEAQKAKIVADAETEIQAASAAARRELQKYAAELAISQAARKLEVTAATDKLLVESFASKLGGKGGQN
ncbi:F-type H+-transporting ATPase subunit b [Bryocella elongata]|uniref:ATP synthase subunit b n=1 Tax=Bryocella elongata TaxID=863522 RepID=A0A1H5ZF49_9BACT|nr:F-type H+-transporting ATPase subunit b [Bryocella elongata]